MKEGGKDTKALAEAAKAQSESTKLIAESAKVSADTAQKTLIEIQRASSDTHDLAEATRNLAKQATISAKATQAVADTATNQLELSERPWVNADIGVDGPFIFNVNGGNITLKFRLLNSGHSPALGTVIQGIPVDVLFVGSGGKDAAQYRDSVCQEATDMIRKFPRAGVDIFPNAAFEQSWTWTFPSAELSKNHGTGTTAPGKIIWPSMVVCIGYRSSFNPLPVYHTAYVLDLMKLDANNQINTTFSIGEDVDQKHLVLRCHSEKCITVD